MSFKEEMKQLLKEEEPQQNKAFNPFDMVNNHMKTQNETMSRRDHFAGLAMHALIQSFGTEFPPKMAIKIADELIAELKK